MKINVVVVVVVVPFKFTGNDSVTLGGGGTVRLSRQDYSFAKAAHKPTQMALRLTDKLFSRETLLRSTVHGTKEFAPLDQVVIAAIKGKFRTYTLVNNKSWNKSQCFIRNIASHVDWLK